MLALHGWPANLDAAAAATSLDLHPTDFGCVLVLEVVLLVLANLYLRLHSELGP
jgi:hypothetical protein